jgi:thiol-disulfide isomerase/thioredoxin
VLRILEGLVEFITLWGAWFLVPFLLVSLIGLIALGRGHRFFLPPTWKGRAGMALLIVCVLFAGFFLYALTGDLGQLSDGVRTLHASVGETAPDVSFRRVSDDTELSLYGVRGEVTLVNLWATWCPPCVKELPELDRLQKSYRERGLVVVTLSQEERERLLKFAAEHDYGTTNVYSEQIGWLEVGNSRPISVILDRDGVVRDYAIGMRDFEGFEEMVRPYMGQASSL